MYKNNKRVQQAWQLLHRVFARTQYTLNFKWLGFTICQVPQDLQAYQEIIWEVKPDLIIETGVALGGTSIFFASMLTLLEACDEIIEGKVIGVDKFLNPDTVKAIEEHPFGDKITLFEGSSTDPEIIERLKLLTRDKKVLVSLDSDHSYKHVLDELRAYSQFVDFGSYIMVNDTGMEDLPTHRPEWKNVKTDNPKRAVRQFLRENRNFIDTELDGKLVITGNPCGYLKRIK